MEIIYYKEVLMHGIQSFIFLLKYNERLTGKEFAERIKQHYSSKQAKECSVEIEKEIDWIHRNYTKLTYSLNKQYYKGIEDD